MTDLYPGMKIEVTAAHVSDITVLPDRPSWLSVYAQWPPKPDAVMYMIDGTSVGICDRCITRDDEVQKLVAQYGGKKIVERGDVSWYCSANFKCGTGTKECRRHWNGRIYDTSRY